MASIHEVGVSEKEANGSGQEWSLIRVQREEGDLWVAIKGGNKCCGLGGSSYPNDWQLFSQFNWECITVLKAGVSVRVVNQLLTEMDGLENRQQVFIMAATNRPGKNPKTSEIFFYLDSSLGIYLKTTTYTSCY